MVNYRPGLGHSVDLHEKGTFSLVAFYEMNFRFVMVFGDRQYHSGETGPAADIGHDSAGRRKQRSQLR